MVVNAVMHLGRQIAFAAVSDEGDLVVRLREGDEAAFASLVAMYQPGLLRLASTVVGSRSVAEEVVQDTWLAVVRGVDRFEGRSSFKTWLFHILLNRARTTAGREHRSTLLPEGDVDDRFDGAGAWATPPVPWSDQVDDRLVAERLARRVREILPTLPDGQREVVVLRDVEGVPAAEVSELLGLTDGNQRVLLHRARARIREQIDAEMGAS
jgi:RNA polymerase sigma-70 factor, ECF subfamily